MPADEIEDEWLEPVNPRDPLPKPPTFTEEEIQECKDNGDYTPILFEWYKFVASLVFVVAHIMRESPALRSIPDNQFHVLTGLLNRVGRLMLSNVALSHKGKFGETTAIVDRCIFESALKVTWLCTDPSDEKFVRYLADGLKTELEFRELIEGNIVARNGEEFPIEKRMLKSISNSIAASQISEDEIRDARKLPDIASMLETVGLDRITYVVSQRIGSHHVHGTWPSLLVHYLEKSKKQENYFSPRGHDCTTHINQYMYIPLGVMRALLTYVQFIFAVDSDAEQFEKLLESTEEEIMRVYKEAIGGDMRS